MQHKCMRRDRRHKDLLALIWVDVHNSLMFSPLIIQSSQNDATKTCISDHIIMFLDCTIHSVIYRKYSLRAPLYKIYSDFTHFRPFPYIWSMLQRPGALATGSSWLGFSKKTLKLQIGISNHFPKHKNAMILRPFLPWLFWTRSRSGGKPGKDCFPNLAFLVCQAVR